jgi:hypothetical protein
MAALDERITSDRGLDLLARHDVEGEIELLLQLVLPLLDEAARRNNKATLQVTADDQLLDEETGHDGFARARIIGKQEPQRLPRQHLAIDGRDLMRQRLDPRTVDGEIGVEQVGKPNPLRLGGDAKCLTITVKAECAARLDQL